MTKTSNLSALQKMRKQKVSFAGFPTPLQQMPRLSKALDGPKLFIKRDDMTDLAFGGNKARKLEFLFADAKNKGADVMISVGALQSNCACMVAAASRQREKPPSNPAKRQQTKNHVQWFHCRCACTRRKERIQTKPRHPRHTLQQNECIEIPNPQMRLKSSFA